MRTNTCTSSVDNIKLIFRQRKHTDQRIRKIYLYKVLTLSLKTLIDTCTVILTEKIIFIRKFDRQHFISIYWILFIKCNSCSDAETSECIHTPTNYLLAFNLLQNPPKLNQLFSLFNNKTPPSRRKRPIRRTIHWIASQNYFYALIYPINSVHRCKW